VVLQGRAITGYLTDLSAAGARITAEGTPPGSDVSVTLELRVGRVPTRSRIPAKVEWVRAEGGGSTFGLSFAGLPTDQQAALQAVVTEFRRLADEIAS
jgi:hypothetical protein